MGTANFMMAIEYSERCCSCHIDDLVNEKEQNNPVVRIKKAAYLWKTIHYSPFPSFGSTDISCWDACWKIKK